MIHFYINNSYYNSQSGNYDNLNLDEWMQSNQEQVQGMAEKLKSEYRNSASTTMNENRQSGYYHAADNGYGTRCNTRCENLAGFTGKSQQELDDITKAMTDQIKIDVENGKLNREQINQPNWFEHRVAQKLEELSKQHQLEYQQNVYQAANRYRNAQYDRNNEYYGRDISNTDNLQQSQQNIFDANDLKQVQQIISDQKQFQQQGSNFQHQYQNQQQTIYSRPLPTITRYHYTDTNRQEEKNLPNPFRTYAIIPATTNRVVEQEIREKRNESRSESVTENKNTKSVHLNRPVATIPQNTHTYNSQHNYEEHYRQEQQQPRLQIYGQRERTNNEEQYSTNKTTIYVSSSQPARTNTLVNNQQVTVEQKTVVEVHTPKPIVTGPSRHSIYSHSSSDSSEIVPNYRPRVVLENTDFETLEHRKDSDNRQEVSSF